MKQVLIPDCELLRRKEVAALLKITTRTLDSKLSGVEIPTYKIGESVRFKKSDVLQYIESKKQPAKIQATCTSKF